MQPSATGQREIGNGFLVQEEEYEGYKTKDDSLNSNILHQHRYQPTQKNEICNIDRYK